MVRTSVYWFPPESHCDTKGDEKDINSSSLATHKMFDQARVGETIYQNYREHATQK
jgi:hypothetical protein